MDHTPAHLRALVDLYRDRAIATQVRFRPATWETLLAKSAAARAPLAALRDDTRTRTSTKVDGDRVIDRGLLGTQLAALDLDDSAGVLEAFLLVQVWGTGLSGGGRAIANTRRAFEDPDGLLASLRRTALTLRSGDDTDLLVDAHRHWRAQGVRQSFFTKWFAFAGRTPARTWQPLILDRRVYATLNDTLAVDTQQMAGTDDWAQAYRAYVTAVHQWAGDLGVSADRMEWVLFEHAGSDISAATTR